MGWVSGREEVGRWEGEGGEGGGEGGWVKDASRHSQLSCACAQWARQITTAALTIQQGEQMSSGTVCHHRPPK